MLEGFDELYDRFFNDKKKLDELIKRLNNFEEIKKIDMDMDVSKLIDRLNDFKEIKLNKKEDSDELENIVEVKIVRLREKSLEKQLDEAIDNEEYEKAAKLRDLINDRNIKNKKIKINNKKSK
jgi:hypothetical protein